MHPEIKAHRIIRKLQNLGFDAVFAGGCVRDMLLEKEPKDFDIATSATPDEVEKAFPNTIPVGKAFGVVRVNMGGDIFEVATFREDSEGSDGRRPDSVTFSSMEEDAKRRDFTINGMFFDPEEGELMDFVGGQKDIENGVLRFIGNPLERIEEDKLRILRGVRFAVTKNLKIEDYTLSAIMIMAGSISSVAQERITEEVRKMFKDGDMVKSIELLKETGLLDFVLPEITPMFDSPQNPKWHPEGDVMEHTKLVLKALPEDASEEVKWASLLHDMGKPATITFDEDGAIRNKGHEHIGAKMAEDMLTRMKFSNDFVEKVVWLVDNHMRVKKAPEMRKAKLRRLIGSPEFSSLVELGTADSKASTGRLEWKTFITNFVKKLENEPILPEPLINGRDLIALGMKPGPMFKEILETVSTKQLEGELLTKEEAVNFVKSLT